jgi:hypothetical protein
VFVGAIRTLEVPFAQLLSFLKILKLGKLPRVSITWQQSPLLVI